MIERLARLWRDVDLKVNAPFANAADATDDLVLLGDEAQRILDSPVLAIALNRVDAKLMRTARSTTPAEVEKRENAYRMVWALEAVKTELLMIAGSGKMKAAERQK